MIIITSSHRPSRRVRSLINDLARTLPRAFRINRGKKSLEDLGNIMWLEGYKILIIVNTRKANPGRVDIYLRRDREVARVGYMVITSVKLSRDQGVPVCFFRSPGIDLTGCSVPGCEEAGEMLRIILSAIDHDSKGNQDAGEIIHVSSRDGLIFIWFTRDGKICGPRIGIRSIQLLSFQEKPGEDRAWR